MVVEVKKEVRATKVYNAILKAFGDRKKGILLEGGTYSSKTYSALQALITIAQETPVKLDINILSESVPHLKGGCLRDFFMIMGESQDHNPYFMQTDHIYHRPEWNGIITFLSADNSKALGMRREILFINEGDTLSWDIAKELISRTNIFIIIDWNPRSLFWAHEYYLKVEGGLPVEGNEGYRIDPDWSYDHSTYFHALDVLPEGKREDIESLGRKDPNYHNIYELGLLGKIEGLVYPSFEQVDVLPMGAYFYGLDYGYEVDPTVLVKNVILGDELYSQEMFYDDTRLTNDQIARKMTLLGVKRESIYADPHAGGEKSSDELKTYGFNMGKTLKGKGSVDFGIQRVNQFYQHWTKDSLNCIKEQRNHRFIKRREGGTGYEYLSDDTTHQWSHGMDARRYAVASHQDHGRKPMAKHPSWRL